MRRVLYWKRLVIAVAALLVFAGAVFAVHRVQTKSQVTVFKTRAEQAEADIGGDPTRRAEVIALYAKYLRFRPSDEGAYQKYAHLVFEQGKASAEPGSAAQTAADVEKFLRAFPAHPEERRQLAELYVKNNKFLNARQHLAMLLDPAGSPYRADVETRELAAECELGMNNLPKAVEHLNEALKTGRAPVRTYKRALELNNINDEDPQRNANVAALLDALVRDPRFAADHEARTAAAQFQRFLGEARNARANIAVALKLPGGDEDPETLLAAAEVAVSEVKTLDPNAPEWKTAEGYLRKAAARDPKHVRVAGLLAEVLVRQGQRAEGVAVLRAAAKLLPPTDPEYALVADRLIDLGEQTESAAMADALAGVETHKVLVPYLRGRLAVLKPDWPTAQRLLEEAAPRVTAVRAFHKKAMVGLAACYAFIENPDKQLEYCRLALRDDPRYPLALVGEAEALFRMGKADEALRRYRKIVNEFQLLDYRPELARLEKADVLGQPVEAAQRNWERFDEALGLPAEADREKFQAAVRALPPELLMLYAEAAGLRGKGEDGIALLRGWVNQNPKHPKAAAAAVALARPGTGPIEAARKALDEFQAAVGDAVDFRLARATLLVRQPNTPGPKDFEKLGEDAGKFSTDEQFRLWFGLGNAAGRVADLLPDEPAGRALRDAALRFLRAAADLRPTDLLCRATLLDHAIAAGQPDAVARALKEIADVEGKDGPFGAMGRIAVELPRVGALPADQQPAARRRLRDLAERARELRGGWSRVYVALARLDELEGQNDAALANYTAAIDKGERQEFVVRRAVHLMQERKQDDKAAGVLNKLSTEVRLPDDLERYRAIREMMLAAELPKNARQTIDRIAPATSDDYRLQLLRGALLVNTRDDDGALLAYREAVRRNGDTVETWGALVSQLVRVNKPAEAKEAVRQAGEALGAALKKLPPGAVEARADLEVGLGALAEAVGDGPGALAHFAAAADLAPRHLNAVRQLVQFLQRGGQPIKADELLTRAAGSPAPDVARWARRHLATTMVGRPDAYAKRGDALALIKRNLDAAPNDAEDLKARAVIWTVDPVTREDGTKVLREYGTRGDLTPDEAYLLGRLAFDQGKFAEAVEWFKLAARVRPGVTPEHLAALVRVYLALDRADLAEGALERLKVNSPNSWEAVREECRLLGHKSRKLAATSDADAAKKLLDQARELIRKFPGWDAGDTPALLSGPLFEELGLTADAKAVYQKFLDASPRPGAHQPLAVLHIRQKQPTEAIALAFARADKEGVSPLLTARLLTGAVRSKRPDKATEDKVEAWLTGALAKAAPDPELHAALVGAQAELLDARGDYDAAIKEYEKSIAAFDRVVKPSGQKDAMVNNLCMLLALTEDKTKRANDAVRMMSELIAVRGPVPAFLDTRAVAYLVSSRPAEAIKDLKMALVQFDRAAYHFHLAWAMDLDPLEEQRVFAHGELQKARRLGLTAADLHPIEYGKYKVLLGKYKLPVE